MKCLGYWMVFTKVEASTWILCSHSLEHPLTKTARCVLNQTFSVVYLCTTNFLFISWILCSSIMVLYYITITYYLILLVDQLSYLFFLILPNKQLQSGRQMLIYVCNPRFLSSFLTYLCVRSNKGLFTCSYIHRSLSLCTQKLFMMEREKLKDM